MCVYKLLKVVSNYDLSVLSTSVVGLKKSLESKNWSCRCVCGGHFKLSSRIPFATISKFGHFRSLHDAPVHSAVCINE